MFVSSEMMKLSQILIPPAIFVLGACSTAKDRYFECVREQQEHMNILKEEIRMEAGRRNAPHLSDTFQKRYGGMFSHYCDEQYKEYQKEKRGY